MADAVLIGVDLGPNLSITGSLATILWLIALRKKSTCDSGFSNFFPGSAWGRRCQHALLAALARIYILIMHVLVFSSS